MHHQCPPEFEPWDHTPPPCELKSKCPISFSNTINDKQEALPPKFKVWYSTEAASYDGAPASMRAGQPTLGYDGEEQQPQLSKQQHPASASIHHGNKDQPPRPKPKPRCTVHKHEDSVSKLVTEQSGMTGQSQPAPLQNFLMPPLAPSKQKGKKKATKALDAPRRTSGRRKNGYYISKPQWSVQSCTELYSSPEPQLGPTVTDRPISVQLCTELPRAPQ
ncbi:uncharacterized protein EDB91DRAFT_1245411 [Suillus paluster]|uniref:uncharacterized protein n=1 Tax=Suillus paluster TaxID=48578 RepID=UPI001B8702A1|nr:uncharacterized protein EDB91DRAFT_1245411 [Suillus paluster]KAG1747946.1 hypothetical protein EDB91DRAFT_1245411 [Suillus paluster]